MNDQGFARAQAVFKTNLMVFGLFLATQFIQVFQKDWSHKLCRLPFMFSLADHIRVWTLFQILHFYLSRFYRQEADHHPQDYGTRTSVTTQLSRSVAGTRATNKTLLSLVNFMPCHLLSARFQPSDFNVSL